VPFEYETYQVFETPSTPATCLSGSLIVSSPLLCCIPGIKPQTNPGSDITQHALICLCFSITLNLSPGRGTIPAPAPMHPRYASIQAAFRIKPHPHPHSTNSLPCLLRMSFRAASSTNSRPTRLSGLSIVTVPQLPIISGSLLWPLRP
jgi:hypothetical protein